MPVEEGHHHPRQSLDNGDGDYLTVVLDGFGCFIPHSSAGIIGWRRQCKLGGWNIQLQLFASSTICQSPSNPSARQRRYSQGFCAMEFGSLRLDKRIVRASYQERRAPVDAAAKLEGLGRAWKYASYEDVAAQLR